MDDEYNLLYGSAAVSIYRGLPKTGRWNRSIDERLAKAVTTSYHDVSLQIWETIAESLIGQVKPKAFQGDGRIFAPESTKARTFPEIAP